MWFIPLTFRSIGSTVTLSYSKRFNLKAEISWLEYVLFKKLINFSERSNISGNTDFISYYYIIKIMGALCIFLICVYFI